jgi:hypothetical protein
MTVCVNCGSEIEAGDDCPRCGAPVSEERKGKALAFASAIVGAVFGIAAAVCMIVDLAGDGKLGWSVVGLASSVEAWLLVGLPLLAYRRPALLLLAMGVSSLAYLKTLESLVGGSWFLPVALPIAVAALASGSLSVFLCLRASKRGPNVAAFILFGGALACLAVENVLSLNSAGTWSFTWSGIVLVSALPTAVLLLGIQKRIRQAS